MRTFRLVVEGHYDEAALKELIQKCAQGKIDVIGRQWGGKVQLMGKFPKSLKEFQYSGLNFKKALVICDADNKDPARLIKTMESKISRKTYPFPIKLLVAVQELEAWLLADENALSAVTGKKPRIIPRPEQLNDPKEKLKKALSDAGIAYTREVARRIATGAKVETIESRCPSFKKFREAVLDC